MTMTKTSANNLVTKTEFRKGMKSTVKTLRGEMRDTTKTLPVKRNKPLIFQPTIELMNDWQNALPILLDSLTK